MLFPIKTHRYINTSNHEIIFQFISHIIMVCMLMFYFLVFEFRSTNSLVPEASTLGLLFLLLRASTLVLHLFHP
jgi:hypothetical protein